MSFAFHLYDHLISHPGKGVWVIHVRFLNFLGKNTSSSSSVSIYCLHGLCWHDKRPVRENNLFTILSVIKQESQIYFCKYFVQLYNAIDDMPNKVYNEFHVKQILAKATQKSRSLLFCIQSKQREDKTDQEETVDASSHIRHAVAIPYPVPHKSLTVQVLLSLVVDLIAHVFLAQSSFFV